MNKKNFSIEETFASAFQQHQKNNLKEAENLYKKILEIDPNHSKTVFYLGSLAVQTKNFDRAKQLFQKTIEIQPNYAEAYNNLGYTFKELGKLDDAVANFYKALSIKPDYIAAYFNHGLAKELLEGKKPYDSKLELDQCVTNISGDNNKSAVQKLYNLCLNSPYNSQKFIQIFLDKWCEKITHMLDNEKFDIAGARIRWLYMVVTYHKPFNTLMQRYFNKIESEKILKTLVKHEKTVHLSMQSQYYYQNGQHDEAEECAKRCLNETKVFFENVEQRPEGWLLVKKSLKNIKDSEKARIILEKILPSLGK